MPNPYGYDDPTVSGGNITVAQFLNSPARVQRAIEELTNERFLADAIFASGPEATGGAVVYDQVSSSDLYTEEDVEAISPGSDFPVLTTTEGEPLVGIARKYGGEVFLTDEAVRRDRRDLLSRETTKLRNTIVRKVDTVAMAALRAAPTNTSNASADWTTSSTDIIADLIDQAEAITSLDMGYEPDAVLVHPTQGADMLKDKDIRDALGTERDDIPVRTGRLGNLLGREIIQSNRLNDGEFFTLQLGMAGGISDEVPLYARPIEEERQEVTFIHGARVVTAYVTDPKAVTRGTGA